MVLWAVQESKLWSYLWALQEWGSRHHSAQGNVRASGLGSWIWAWFAWAGGRLFANVVHLPLVHKRFVLWARTSQVQFPLDISQFTVQESTSFGWSFSMIEAFSACIAWWTHTTAFPFCTLKRCWSGPWKNWEIHFLWRFYLSVKSSLNRPVVPAHVKWRACRCTPRQPAWAPLHHFHRRQSYSNVGLDWPTVWGGCEI